MSQSASRPQSQSSILIAGIGNIFLGDDGFGCEVAQRLLRRETKPYSAGVEIVDFGIRGVELAYTLLDGYDNLILIDTVARGGAPGTLYLLEIDQAQPTPEQGTEAGRIALDAHSMDPVKMLAFARALGAQPGRTLLVGCEPSPLDTQADDFDIHPGLSQSVEAAISEAIQLIDTLVAETLVDTQQATVSSRTKESSF
ncbi:hydrogenase maturation protease [Ktedonobacter robiniae]|uniref:Peptidase M52 n=1 Tax=Ktedonobacter robiniae TaxID=2778365 RepID=A0ABQ3USS8_9CHLR|nr:hydrogenase maturation protease [Ktedonobacter robiniae]GHO55435.1 peptidase M52 [Ktedonobacter robiniae]